MLKQFLSLKLSQKLSPQQIQLMNLVQLPTQAFEQRLKDELFENPALENGIEDDDILYDNDEFDNNEEEYDDYEEGSGDTIDNEINIDEYLSDDEIPEYKLQSNNYSTDDDIKEIPYVTSVSFHQDLINQLTTLNLTEEEYNIAEFIVGSMDDDGYLRRRVQNIVDDLAFTQSIYTDEKTVEKALQIVRSLGPIGMAAFDLQDCLLIQLKHKTQTRPIKLAIIILEKYFDLFIKKFYDKIVILQETTKIKLKNAIAEIERLNPRPVRYTDGNDSMTEQVIPDFTIHIVDGELELTLNGKNAPVLHISNDYQQMLQTYNDSRDKSNAQKDAVQFIKQKLDAAKWFIDAVKQRQETLYITMNAIMHYQQEYLLDGEDVKLRPMILKDIADMIGTDISTVSRVVNSKYVDTPYGTKLLKDFFSDGMKNDQGEDVSTLQVKKILKTTIEQEDKKNPLNDDQLVEILKEKGFTLARRTISKYREFLGIPVARIRKKI